MSTPISFQSNDLQTTYIQTESIEHENYATIQQQVYAVANANKSVIPKRNYPSRSIRISGTVTGDDIEDLDNRLDTFRSYFDAVDGNLDIGYAGSTRRYIATTERAPTIDRPYGLLYAIFTIDFICTEPFGLDTTTTNLWTAKTGFTSATFTETPTVGGNAPTQLPIITITVNSLTGDGDYLLISNDNNNQELMIYGQGIAADDVIVIDCEQRTVTINDTEIDFYGTFLELEPGSNSITYTDGFTTRDIDISAVYTKRWL